MRGSPLLLAALLAAAPAAAQDVVVGAAGDIACDPADGNWNGGYGTASGCRMAATSDLLLSGVDLVLPLGDTQYEDGALAKYLASYDPSWGRVKGITRPVPGNHEYGTAGAAGYYGYFGAAGGDPAKGWYSFDVGKWHVVVLNGNCAQVGGCGAGSPQEQWLAADLAAHRGVCTLAAWHQPRFSSGPHGDDATYDAFWRDLYDAGADVVLNGHDHVYERFAPQDPDAAADPYRGIRAFVVGTGGKNLTYVSTPRANSEVRRVDTFGVLKLVLKPASYDWVFLPAAGGSFTDSGSTACHESPRPLAFHALTPCRLADTRRPDGPSGGPALGPGARRFPATSVCGVPESAAAVALNVTAVGASAPGSFRLGAAGRGPGTGAVSFPPVRARAGAAVSRIGAYGDVALEALIPPGATAHAVLDVAGWFE